MAKKQQSNSNNKPSQPVRKGFSVPDYKHPSKPPAKPKPKK